MRRPPGPVTEIAAAVPVQREDRPVAGIVMMMGFVTLAPVMDAFAKLAGEVLPAGQIAFFRFALQVAMLAPLTWAMGRLARPRPGEIRMHVFRAALVLAATGLFFEALRHMPLADAIAIFFVEPFILTLMSARLLGEKVGWRRFAACLVGFAGALLVIRPSFVALGWVALLPLGTAVLISAYLVVTRRMARHLDPFDLQAWTAVAAMLLAVLALAAGSAAGVAPLTPVLPPAWVWWVLIGLGAAASVSHLCVTFAFRDAPASVLAPLSYLEIVTATALGLVVFGDFPDPMARLGIAIIVGAGLFVAWRERRVARRAS